MIYIWLCNKTFYPIYDDEYPGNADLIERTRAEEAYNEEYFARTGLRYRYKDASILHI